MPDLPNIKVPVFVKINGQLQPNPLFHRSFDRLHSRCIEYPFAASEIGDARIILDVGTAKSSIYWVKWLEGLEGVDVYGVDYDKADILFEKIKYRQADVRRLPFESNYFDKISAVSVIEHIGLANPQVFNRDVPELDENGDVEAVRELARVLKPGGRLIMTFPYGIREGLMKNKQARTYTEAGAKKFEKILRLVSLDYFEYQHVGAGEIFDEESADSEKMFPDFKKLVLRIRHWLGEKREKPTTSQPDNATNVEGSVTWRKIDIKKAKAVNQNHVDGVLCSVWQK